MHYVILKNIVETTLRHFRCAQCGAEAHESAVVLEKADAAAADLRIVCPACGAAAQVRAAVHAVGDKMPLTVSQRPAGEPGAEPENIIKDRDIASAARDIASCNSLEDLLK